jgi:hypothetical protein
MSPEKLDFDPVDRELRRRLGGPASGRDAGPVLEELRPRLRRARRRHHVTTFGAGLVVVAVAVATTLSVVGGATPFRVQTRPAAPGPSPIATTLAPPTSTAPGGARAGGDQPAASTGVPATANPGVGGAFAGTGAPVSTTSTPPPVPATQRYSSAGGSIVVQITAGAVSLVSNTPADGFTANVHDDGPDRVEVRFDRGDTEWRIRVDVVNGQLVAEITQS